MRVTFLFEYVCLGGCVLWSLNLSCRIRTLYSFRCLICSWLWPWSCILSWHYNVFWFGHMHVLSLILYLINYASGASLRLFPLLLYSLWFYLYFIRDMGFECVLPHGLFPEWFVWQEWCRLLLHTCLSGHLGLLFNFSHWSFFDFSMYFCRCWLLGFHLSNWRLSFTSVARNAMTMPVRSLMVF